METVSGLMLIWCSSVSQRLARSACACIWKHAELKATEGCPRGSATIPKNQTALGRSSRKRGGRTHDQYERYPS